MRAIARAALLLPALLLTACGGEPPTSPPTGNDEVSTPVEELDSDRFVDGVDNPFLPLVPGSTWVYRGTADERRTTTTVVVLQQTRDVAGVDAAVVREVVKGPGGKVLERSEEWFAQDRAGNVWLLGEKGVWETGVGGAGAGIAMLAEPRVGDGYRMEHLAGTAEDLASVLELDAEVTVPAGEWTDVLKTEDTNPLEPEVVQHRYYVEDVGLVRSETVSGGDEMIELIGFTPGE
jgi:hypothetical protein